MGEIPSGVTGTTTKKPDASELAAQAAQTLVAAATGKELPGASPAHLLEARATTAPAEAPARPMPDATVKVRASAEPDAPVIEIPVVRTSRDSHQQELIQSMVDRVTASIRTGTLSRIVPPDASITDVQLVAFLDDADRRLKAGADLKTVYAEFRTRMHNNAFDRNEAALIDRKFRPQIVYQEGDSLPPGAYEYDESGKWIPVEDEQRTDDQKKAEHGVGSPRAVGPQPPSTNVPGADVTGFTFQDPDAQHLYKGILDWSGGRVSAGDAQEISNDIARLIRKGKLPAEDVTALKQVNERLLTIMREQSDQNFSSLYLNNAEMQQLIDNPAAFFDPALRILEDPNADPESFLFKAAEHRLEIAGEFWGSEQHAQMQINFDSSVTPEQRALLRARIQEIRNDPKKAMLGEQVAARISAVYARTDLSRGTGDLKKFSDRMKRFGDRGLNLLEAGDGGAVGDWARRYETIIADVTRGKRYSAVDEKIAANIAVEQLMAERANYEGRRAEYYAQWQNDPNLPLPESVRTIDETAARSIIERAHTAWRLRMRKGLIMDYATPPGESEYFGEGSAYQTMSIEEAMLGTKFIRDWFLRKWGNKRAFLMVWNQGARFAGNSKPELKDYIKEQTNQLWQRAFATGTDAETVRLRDKALERIRFLVKMNDPDQIAVPDFDLRSATIPQTELAAQRGTLQEYIREMSKKKLYDYVLVEEGGARMQAMLRPYFYLDSMWRSGSYQRYASEALVNGDQYFLAAKIRGAGEAYFFNPMPAAERNRSGARTQLVDALSKASDIRPQSIIDFLVRGEHEGFESWFESNKGDLGFDTAGDLIRATNRRFLMINQQLMQEGVRSISFNDVGEYMQLASLAPADRAQRLQGMDATRRAQWEIIDRVFSIPSGDGGIDTADRYFSVMGKLHSYLKADNSAVLHDLTHVKYDKLYYSMAWEDDAPTHLLENPVMMIDTSDPDHAFKRINRSYLERIGILKPGQQVPDFRNMSPEDQQAWQNKIYNAAGISELLTDGGSGPGSPLGRAWSDYSAAMEAFAAFTDFRFAPDDKKFFETMATIWGKIDMYQGQFLATEAALQFGAAYIGSAQVKTEFGPLFSWMAGSSVFKDARGDMAPSLEMEGVMHLREQMDKLIGKTDKYAPHMSDQLDRFLRLSTLSIPFSGGKPIIIPGIAPEGITWHELLKPIEKTMGVTEKIPLIGKVLNTHNFHKFMESEAFSRFEESFHLGYAQYKAQILLAYALVITAGVAADQARKGGKEGSSH